MRVGGGGGGALARARVYVQNKNNALSAHKKHNDALSAHKNKKPNKQQKYSSKYASYAQSVTMILFACINH